MPRRILGLSWDNGKENGNYCLGIGGLGFRVFPLDPLIVAGFCLRVCAIGFRGCVLLDPKLVAFQGLR